MKATTIQHSLTLSVGLRRWPAQLACRSTGPHCAATNYLGLALCRGPSSTVAFNQALLLPQQRWQSSAAKGKAVDKRPVKRTNFDAGRKEKQVHILEAKDRVLSRIRDKKRDAAEAKPKKPTSNKATTKKGAGSKEKEATVEVVGDGVAPPKTRQVAAPVRTIEPTREQLVHREEEEKEEARKELLPPMTLNDVMEILSEEKALFPMVLDISQKCVFAHYMVIVEGRSGRHLRAMAERLMAEMQVRQRHPEANVGLDVDRGNDDWIMVDAGDMLIQLFSPGARRYYDLEGLWILQKRTQDRDPSDEITEVEDLDPLPDLDDVPNGWNPFDQTVARK